MGSLRTIIIDDEEEARKLLRQMLQNSALPVNIIAEADSVKKGVAAISFHKPDLVLLDIELSDGNGFEILDQLKDHAFHVIFITGYDHYAIKAFRYSAMDYLLKPVHYEHLKQSIEKVKELQQPELEKLNHFKRQFSESSNTPKQIVVSHGKGYSFIKLEDIVKIEASGSYVYFHLQGEKKILANYNLGYYEEFLPEDHFFRAHKSFIVNLAHVRHYEAARGGSLVLSDNSKVEVAQRRKPLLMTYLRNYNTE